MGSGKLLEEEMEDKVRLNKQDSNGVWLVYQLMCNVPEQSRSRQFFWSLDLCQVHNVSQDSIEKIPAALCAFVFSSSACLCFWKIQFGYEELVLCIFSNEG